MKTTTENTEATKDLLTKNMEFAAVIRALRANAREDAATIDRLQRERDELFYIAERAIALAEIDFENDKFGVVSELRGDLEKIKEGVK